MKNSFGKHVRVGSLVLVVAVLALTVSSSALSSPPPQEPPPPSEIGVSARDNGRQIELSEGQVLVVSLEGNPSTGYGWQLQEPEVGPESEPLLRQTGESEFDSESGVMGAPGIQTLRFHAVEAGRTTLRLVYRRSWEDLPPAGTFSLEVEGVGSFEGGDVPLPTPTPTPPPESVDAALLGDDVAPAALPSYFNWCDLGGCTPIRDQGQCGSCWAFSTVGPLESNILIQEGRYTDLSEQYLVSCNVESPRFNCDGGNYAHDYHEWKFGSSEPGPGAVYEADFPYEADDVPCGPAHAHHELIDDWFYVGGSSPSVAAIKQAIYDYGPVSALVCSSTSGFQNYTGGVFASGGCTVLDHAIVLVGWDDSRGNSGAWRLRNSWGTSWGEGGYMWIGYGVSNVGRYASYIIYTPDCYTLNTSVNPAGGGTVTADPVPSCDGEGYQPGTEVELTANKSPGWQLTHWSGDASGSDNPTTVTMDSHKSVTAHFMCDGCVPQAFLPLVTKDY